MVPRALGWRVRVVWECEITSTTTLDKIACHISREINRHRPKGRRYK